MARANPARSPYAATRHLLKHLRDPRELRRNPLARSEFFGQTHERAARAIAARVDAALDRIGDARQLAILVRIDINGHDPRGVAADLGLSTRQFYRERRLALQAFHNAYLMPAHTCLHVESNDAPDLLTRATALADSGERSSALAILGDVLAGGANVTIGCDALLRVATIETWAHRFDAARTHLDACRELLSRSTAEPDAIERLDDGLAATALLVRWFDEGPSSLIKVRDDGKAQGDRTLLVRASAALRTGESSYASALLSRLTNQPRAVLPPEDAVDLLNLQAEFANFAFSDPSVGEDLFARAAAVASAHGLRGRALYSSHQLAVARWMHSGRPEDRRAYRRLADAVDLSLPARQRSILALVAADVEVAVGRPERGLAAARTAATLSTNRYEVASASALTAAALFRMQRVEDAVAEAALATETARAEGHARVLSLAQRICAQAHFVKGNRRAARSAIDESIECARRFSSPYVQAQAQAIRGRITGR